MKKIPVSVFPASTVSKGFLGLCLLLLCLPLHAQHNNRSGRDLQFRFGNPGARSLGFGGAFIALADDATAPVANPAGMVRTSQRSASFEFNYNHLENNILFAGGRIQQTNIFEFDFELDQTSASEDIYQVPYLAVVIPKDKWRYAFYVQQQANLQRTYTNNDILFCHLEADFYPECQNDDNPDIFPASNEDLSLKMLNVGGSLAVSLSDNFSLGLSLFYSDFSYRANSVQVIEQIVGDSVVSRLANGDDTQFGGTLGAIWQVTQDLSVGATYKYQPEFDYEAELTKSRAVPNLPPDFVTAALFKIPDSIALGITIKPMDVLTINVDANRVFYSQITDNLIDFSEFVTGSDNVTQSMSDVTEIHAGVEWIFTNFANPLSLRLGYWLDPYHAPLNNIRDSQLLEGPSNDPVTRDIFFLYLFEEDEQHYSMGLGWTFGTKFQLDVAADIGDNSQNATLSGIYRF